MNSAARKMDRKTAGNFWGSHFMLIKQYKQRTKEMSLIQRRTRLHLETRSKHHHLTSKQDQRLKDRDVAQKVKGRGVKHSGG